MKLVETKIYLKFISWFILVSLLPVLSLITAIYLFDKNSYRLINQGLLQAVTFGLLVSLAFIFLLSLLATRRLSASVTRPIQTSLGDLSKVVNDLSKSIQNLSEISQNSGDLSSFLLTSSQNQQAGIKTGSKAVSGIAKSLNQINLKTDALAKNSNNINSLASDSSAKSKEAIDSLVAVKHLVTENQKLSQALDHYAYKVGEIAKALAALSENAKFLSLNASIGANKFSYSEEFSSLISQIRELNVSSEQAAVNIASLANDMGRQIEQAKQSSVYQWEETSRSIVIVSQTIKFLGKIVANISGISQSIQTIHKETKATKNQANNINDLVSDLNKESRSLVQHIDNVTQIINKELVLTRSLNRSAAALNKVTDTLNNLVGKN